MTWYRFRDDSRLARSVAILSLGLGLAGCAASASRPDAEASKGYLARGAMDGFSSDAADAPPAPPEAASIRGLIAGDNTMAQPATPPRTGQRLMIYSASYGVLVANAADSIARFLAWVEQRGGYLQQRNDDVLTAKVPAARFEEMVDLVPTLGVVLSESLSAQDVTRQHFDVTTRLDNAKRARQRLVDLLQRAVDVEEILKIEKELHRLTTEIERLEGELKLLNQQIAFSTVQVSFQTDGPPIKTGPRRGASRFAWVNRIGIEQVLKDF